MSIPITKIINIILLINVTNLFMEIKRAGFLYNRTKKRDCAEIHTSGISKKPKGHWIFLEISPRFHDKKVYHLVHL